MALGDWGDARLVPWVRQLFQGVAAEDLVVELGLPLGIEGKAPDLAFHVTGVGSIPIVLGTARAKFLYVVPRLLQLISEIPQGRLERVVGALHEDDTIRIRVEEPVPQLVHYVIQF